MLSFSSMCWSHAANIPTFFTPLFNKNKQNTVNIRIIQFMTIRSIRDTLFQSFRLCAWVFQLLLRWCFFALDLATPLPNAVHSEAQKKTFWNGTVYDMTIWQLLLKQWHFPIKKRQLLENNGNFHEPTTSSIRFICWLKKNTGQTELYNQSVPIPKYVPAFTCFFEGFWRCRIIQSSRNR